jgi:hypothetical protein
VRIVSNREINQPEQGGKEGFCLGRVWVDNKYAGYTLEDQDRYLEHKGNKKVQDKTAIPRGTYEVKITFSNRFQKPMIQLMNVPTHTGIRCHGANNAEQLQGCIAVGSVRTVDGVAKCSVVVDRIFNMVQACEDRGEKVTWTIE